MNGLADLSEPDLRSLGDHRDIFYPYCGAPLGFENGCSDVLHVPHEPYFANVDLLRPLFYKAASPIRIGVRQLLLDLSQAQTVRHQLVGIDADLIFPRDTAKRRVV